MAILTYRSSVEDGSAMMETNTMDDDSRFKVWAIDRANQIVASQVMDLLRTAADQTARTAEQSVIALVLAITEALGEARNVRSQEYSDPVKTH
ncbi:hypothetical protein CPY51_05585 [Rhizobium tubonense]|uniref:Uncharacterized protein n=2 Tax=Rhizobium tubonense TaxID=484088 RepID=A0A2W4CU72_9HYPH|nr:hypothetical protein CPY51_05585 [Rhizobium tubonense]